MNSVYNWGVVPPITIYVNVTLHISRFALPLIIGMRSSLWKESILPKSNFNPNQDVFFLMCSKKERKDVFFLRPFNKVGALTSRKKERKKNMSPSPFLLLIDKLSCQGNRNESNPRNDQFKLGFDG